MRVPSVGWAFFGLAVLALTGYVLNRGIYIGSDTTAEREEIISGVSKRVYKKYCRYLHFAGVREDWRATEDFEADANNALCSMFYPISN
jgi:hypothetical protein